MATADHTIRRAGLFVVLPTTDQPIIIKKLAWSARVPISRVVLATESSEVCEPWSTQYGNLLRPGEPLRSILGLPDSGSYRLAASAAIDQGKSWMVAVAAAHCGLAQGEAMTAKASEAKLLLWGTGAIDLSVADIASEARIVAQEYHLTTKIDRSRHLFAEAAHAGTPVLAFVPHGDEAERAASILAKVLAGQPHHIAVAASLADIMAPIECFLRSGVFEPVVVKPPEPSTAITPFAAKAEAPAPETVPDTPEPYAAAMAAEPPRARSAVLDHAGSSRSLRRIALLSGAAVIMAGAAAAIVMTRQGAAPVTPAPTTPVIAVLPPQPRIIDDKATQPAPAPVPPPPAVIAGPALARLTTLSPPPGSSCEAQVYEPRQRFVETAIDVPDATGPLTIETQEICGVALAPLGTARVRFQAGTGAAAVPSLSHAQRIIFNPTGTRGGQAALPTIQIDEPKALRIEIIRRQ